MKSSPHIRIIRHHHGNSGASSLFFPETLSQLLLRLEQPLPYPEERWSPVDAPAVIPFRQTVMNLLDANRNSVTAFSLNLDTLPETKFQLLKSPSFVVDDTRYCFFAATQAPPEDETPDRQELGLLRFTDNRDETINMLSLLLTGDYSKVIFAQSEPGERSPLWGQLREIWKFLQVRHGRVGLD